MIKNLATKQSAYYFILLIGIVSLFADITYEGARSITGPYLGILGANAAMVGLIAGLGEFLGYALRLISGYFSDYTGRYWPIMITGYAINLIAVPLLAFAGNWWIAGILIVLERIGKGIRVPPRDAMLSHAARHLGMGLGFGLHESLDRVGAMTGPLFVSYLLYRHSSYQYCFLLFIFPALAALSMLLVTRLLFPQPDIIEGWQTPNELSLKKNKVFWIYLAGASFIAMGYADFALIAFHFNKIQLFSPAWIPITYAIALGANILMAPIVGHLYDRIGLIVMVMMMFIASFFPALIFLGGAKSAFVGVFLWGVGFGAQGSLMPAIVASMVSKNKRATAYGVFNSVFGFFWFIGSCVMGILYDFSLDILVAFSISVQLLSLPLFWKTMNLLKNQ